MRIIKLSIMLGLVVSFGMACACAASKPYLLTSDPYPPYLVGQEGHEVESGLVMPLFEHIFSGLKLQFESRLEPWNKALAMLYSGDADFTLAKKGAIRAKHLRYSVPIVKAQLMFFYNAKASVPGTWDSWRDMKPYTIALIKGYGYGLNFYKATMKYHIDVRYSDSLDSNNQRLLRGDVDYIVANRAVEEYKISQNPALASIKPLSKPIREDYLGIAVSKESSLAKYVPKMDKIIRALKASGTFGTMLKGHGAMVNEYPQQE